MAAGEGAAPRRFMCGGGEESCHAGLVISNRCPCPSSVIFPHCLCTGRGFILAPTSMRLKVDLVVCYVNNTCVSNVMHIDEDRTELYKNSSYVKTLS